MNYEFRKQMLAQASAFSQSSAELNRKIDSWNRSLAENQRANELELARLKQQKTEQISEVQEGTAIASGENSGKWFAGGTRTPSAAELLEAFNDPSQQKELFAEVQFELDQQRASSKAAQARWRS